MIKKKDGHNDLVFHGKKKLRKIKIFNINKNSNIQRLYLRMKSLNDFTTQKS